MEGNWFTSTEKYEREIESPNGAKATVVLRRLNAGDQAAIQDTMRLIVDTEETSLKLGTLRHLTVQKAVLDWDIPGPKPSPEAIAQLHPDVFEQIYAAVEFGSAPDLQVIDGSPTPPNRQQRRAAAKS